MRKEKILLLNKQQIRQRINRIAYQVYEDNFEEQEIIIAGIAKSGYVLAERIAAALHEICKIKIHLIEVKLNKKNPLSTPVEIPLEAAMLQGKVIILVDDVLNTGKTMIYALKKFLTQNVKKIRTVLLVDRDHKHYPVVADFVGITLSTTLQEHVAVEFGGDGEAVFLM